MTTVENVTSGESVTDLKQTILRMPEDWKGRLDELAADAGFYGRSQLICAILHPFLSGWLKAEFEESGELIAVVGRNAAGERVEAQVNREERPVKRLTPVSEPPRMGRPSKD